MTEIVDRQVQEKLDLQLINFLSRERQIFAILVDRKMVTAGQLHEMEWASVEALTERMDEAEIFALLSAIASVSKRYRLQERDDDPFWYPFELGFGERMRDALTAWEVDEGPSTGHDMIVSLMRQYAKDTLYWLLDHELTVEKIWDRVKEAA